MLVMLCRGRTPVRPAHSAEFFGVFYFMSPAICGTRRGASPTEKQISYQQKFLLRRIFWRVLFYVTRHLRDAQGRVPYGKTNFISTKLLHLL